MNISNKQELQEIAFNHSSDIDFEDFLELLELLELFDFEEFL